MKSSIEKILNNYLEAMSETFSRHPMQNTVTSELKNQIIDASHINTQEYQVKGSAGQGQWANLPWLGIFDKDITKTAQKGFYIVYLFSEDMSGVYLSLNQGYTWYKNTFGHEAINKIQTVATSLRRKLRSDCSGFPETVIDLKPTKDLGKGYEAGNIIAKYYPKGQLPSQTELVNDLSNLIGIFREMKAILPDINNDAAYIAWVENCTTSIETGIEEDDVEFQLETQNIEPEEFIDSPENPPGSSDSNTHSRIKRKPQKAQNALKRADYQFEINPEHTTFEAESSGQNYVEAHHIIPLSDQPYYPVSLDVEANIVALCPLCHRKIHYGKANNKNEMTQILLEARKERLKNCNISLKA